MEEDIDIYEDLPNFNVEADCNFAEKNKELTEKCFNLEKQVSELSAKLEALQKANKTLEVNLSSLLKTAKAEISRKDRMIAETREELSNVVFRRGVYGRSNKAKERQSSKLYGRHIKKETVSSLDNNVMTSNYTESTEYFCSGPSSSHQNEDEDTEQKYEPEKVVNTVFGKRLHKKLTEEQELEQKQKKQKKEEERLAREEEAIKTRAITEANKESTIDNKENQSQCEKVSSLSSTEILNLSDNASTSSKHRAILAHKHERKRVNNEEASKEDCKKIKLDQHGSEYNRRQRHLEKLINSHSDQSQNANQYRHAKRDDWKFNETRQNSVAEDSECIFNSLPTEERKHNPPDDTIVTANAKTTDDKHTRVTSRLMLLAEGIDPDRTSIPHVDRSKRLSVIKRDRSLDARSRSRSRDREMRHDKGRRYRSRSRSQEKRYERRPTRSRDERYRSSRDKFEKRRDYRNKDGDNLSEFSREIYDLRERIENKCEDRDSKDTHSSRNRKHESRPKKDRSKSRDSNSNSGIDKGGKQSRVSSKIISDNTRTISSKCTGDESSGKLKSKAANKSSKDKNAETVSLQSLEDGEILDTPNSSPRKANPCKIENPIDYREKSPKNPIDVIVDNINTDKVCNNSARNVAEKVSSKSSDYHLNSSKDERIENIELFIQNYDSNEAKLELACNDVGAVEKEMKLSNSTGNIKDVLEKSGNEIVENIGNSDKLSESCGKLEMECADNMKKTQDTNTMSTITDNSQLVKIQSSSNDADPLQKEKLKLKDDVKDMSGSSKCSNHIDDIVPNSKSGMRLLQSTYFGNKKDVMLTDTNSSNHQIIVEHEVNQESSVNNNGIVRSSMNCNNQANVQEENRKTIENNKNSQNFVEQVLDDNSLTNISAKKINANNKSFTSEDIDVNCKNHTDKVEEQIRSNENELNTTSDDIMQSRKINNALDAIETIAENSLDKSETSSTDFDTDSASENSSDASNISNASESNNLSDEPENMESSKKVVHPTKSTSANKKAPVRKKVLVNSPKKQCKVIVVARRRKPVQLSDTPASMTVVLTTTNSANNSACTSKTYDLK